MSTSLLGKTLTFNTNYYAYSRSELDLTHTRTHALDPQVTCTQWLATACRSLIRQIKIGLFLDTQRRRAHKQCSNEVQNIFLKKKKVSKTLLCGLMIELHMTSENHRTVSIFLAKKMPTTFSCKCHPAPKATFSDRLKISDGAKTTYMQRT